MKSIFDEVKLSRLQLKNRLIRSATWEGIENRDGSLRYAPCRLYLLQRLL